MPALATSIQYCATGSSQGNSARKRATRYLDWKERDKLSLFTDGQNHAYKKTLRNPPKTYWN